MKNQQPIPNALKTENSEVLYWVEISDKHKPIKKVFLYDISAGKPDPNVRYLAIIFEDVPGYDGYYLVCYFDDDGNWITQSPFDILDEAFDHGKTAFGVPTGEWNSPVPK